MKINTTQTVKNLKGQPYEAEEGPLTVGEAIAAVLANDDSTGKMKLYVLAKKFIDEEEVDLDSADLSLVKQAVERSKTYSGNNIVLGSLLVLLDGGSI